MGSRSRLPEILLFSGMLGFVVAPAYADAACDAEVVAIQAELDAPDAGVSSADLEQATQLFNVLSADCDSGTPFDAVAPISLDIRSLLGMGAS